MTFPTFKYATDTNPGTSAIYGAPDIVYAFHVIDGSHATDRIPIAAIEGTAVALSGTQVISGAKQFNNISMEFNSPTTGKQYIVNTSDITSNRNITLPLLVGDDTFVFANFTQTLTNKTLSGSQNTFSSIPASAITNTAAVLSVANTFVALQTISPTTTNAITINPPSAPVGSSSAFQGGIKVASGTIGFITTAQSGDYTTNYLDQTTLTNPSSGTVTNAATLKIIGAPIASTNVTITNAYTLWVAAGTTKLDGSISATGLLTSTGGITMSSSNITLGSNSLITTTFNISESDNDYFLGQPFLLSRSVGTNKAATMQLRPTGTAVRNSYQLARVSDSTNWEALFIASDYNSGNEFEIISYNNGTGTLRPITVWMKTTKLLSFDTANTITSYVQMNIAYASAKLLLQTPDSTTAPIVQWGQVAAIAWNAIITSTSGNWNLSIDSGQSAMTVSRSGTSVLDTSIDNGTLSMKSTVAKYNNISTAGIGAVPVYGSTKQKSETGADTNVLTLTPPAVAGSYRIKISVDVSAASVATWGWTATWKDSNGNAQAPTNLAFDKAGSATLNLTITAAANDHYTADAYIDIDNSATNIVVKTTFTGTSIAYKISASIEQIQ